MGPYDDIIDLPHHVSATRPQMPIANRAAQFSPFQALTGYDSAIAETARLTDRRIELGESDIAALEMKLNMLVGRLSDHPEIAVTYYQPDTKKEGGSYITATGQLKNIDDYAHNIVLMNGDTIAITDILDIECALFAILD